MARYVDATCKLCRREGVKLFLKGEKCTTKKCPLERKPYAPGKTPNQRFQKRISDYGRQLREKQKVKRAYGLLESSMRKYYDKATKMKGIVGQNMLSLLERRLDNVVFRMGIASSRAQARQMVNHGIIKVNGIKVDIASYQVQAGDTISINETKKQNSLIKDLKGLKLVTPKWLEFDSNSLEGKIISLPEREDIDLKIEEHLIVELYSR